MLQIVVAENEVFERAFEEQPSAAGRCVPSAENIMIVQ
jgi:hypothetical protein